MVMYQDIEELIPETMSSGSVPIGFSGVLEKVETGPSANGGRDIVFHFAEVADVETLDGSIWLDSKIRLVMNYSVTETSVLYNFLASYYEVKDNMTMQDPAAAFAMMLADKGEELVLSRTKRDMGYNRNTGQMMSANQWVVESIR